MRKYWYKTYIECCPICGRQDTWKERHYSPKPEDINERTEYRELYDYCEEGYA